MRKPKKGQSLAEKYPELAAQWHPTKNGELTPYNFTCGSNKKVWWRCEKGDDHEWTASVKNRSHGNGCPVCSGRKAVHSNCLATINPDLAKQWHPTKNYPYTPLNVTGGSEKKVWWKCEKGDDHEWTASVKSRSRGNGCSVCHGLTIVSSNCLATLKPELANEWHPTKNGKLTPYDVTHRSNKRVWWKCDVADDHEWQSRVADKDKGVCPCCSGKNVVQSNCLATLKPELANEWHPTKNGKLTPFDVTKSSQKSVWWKCDVADDHEWIAKVGNRLKTGCPYCSGKKASATNCLANTFPELTKMWHPTKNGKLTPYDVTKGTMKRVWWKCDVADDHEWKAIVNSVFSNFVQNYKTKGCPMCSGYRVVKSNSLAHISPHLSKEWHPSLNEPLNPTDVAYTSGLKYWWQCSIDCDHIWSARISDRYRGSKCPYCTLTPQSNQELTITFELSTIFPAINPRGFKTRIEGKLWTIDIYIPSLNLGVEFDGSYWHKDKRALDKLKTKKLQSDGFNILRVREEPLKKISDSDILSKQPFNAKEVTNNILNHIMNSFDLEAKLVKKIKAYISKKKLQNEKGLDEYIEMILTEKADKDS